MKTKIFTIMVLLLTFTSYAQEDFSTETFSFIYPEDWTITEQNETSVIFSAPIAATGEGQTGGFSIQTDGMSIFVVLEETPMNALELAESQLEDIADGDVFTAEPVIEYVINNHDAAMVDSNSMLFSWRIITMSLDEDYTMLVTMTGVTEQFIQATPLVFDLLNSVRLAGDDTPVEPLSPWITLEQSHTRTADGMVFEYPAGWDFSEEETYTLLIIPDSTVTIGVSGIPYPPDSPVDEAELSSIVDEFIGIVTDQYPSFEVAQDLTVVSLNEDQTAVTALLIDEAEDYAYGYIVYNFGDNFLGRITVIGGIDDMAALFSTPLAIAASSSTPKGISN